MIEKEKSQVIILDEKPKPGEKIKKIPVMYYSLMFLIVLVVVLTIGNSSFLYPYNIKTVGNMISILLTIGLGELFVILIGSIDLSVGGIVSMVSIVYIMCLERYGAMGFLITILVAAAAGLFNGIIFTRLKIPAFIATLGSGGIFTSIAYLLHDAPLAAPKETYKYIDFINGSIGPINVSWIIALILFLTYFIIQKYTYIGRMVYLIGSNEKMSWMSGLKIQTVKIFSFVLSGIGAGVSGIILASNLYSGSAVFGDSYILEAVAVVIVGGNAITGGAGGVVNTLVGACILGIIKNGMTIIGIDIYAQQLVLGVLIIIAVSVTFDRSKVVIIK